METVNEPTWRIGPIDVTELSAAHWIDVTQLTDDLLDQAAAQCLPLQGNDRERLRTAIYWLARHQFEHQQVRHRSTYTDACHLGTHTAECWER